MRSWVSIDKRIACMIVRARHFKGDTITKVLSPIGNDATLGGHTRMFCITNQDRREEGRKIARL